jgi:hypothetical protein
MVPEDGAIDEPINVEVVLSFTESMDIMAAVNAISIFPASSWDYDWDPSQTVLTMTPTVDLQSDTQYTIKITTGAMSKVGIPLAFKFESSFKTGSFLSRTTLGIPSIIWIIIAIAITVVAIVIFIRRRRQKRLRKTISSTQQYEKAEEIRIPLLYPQHSWPRNRKGGRSN